MSRAQPLFFCSCGRVITPVPAGSRRRRRCFWFCQQEPFHQPGPFGTSGPSQAAACCTAGPGLVLVHSTLLYPAVLIGMKGQRSTGRR